MKTKTNIHRGNMNVALCFLYYRVNIYEKKILLTLCTYFSISLCQYDGRLKKKKKNYNVLNRVGGFE